MKNWVVAAVALAWLMVTHAASAQLTPLDVRASAPILDAAGSVLPGTLTNFGCANAPGGLVQILKVGTGNIAHLPNLDGTPSGGDTVLFTTVIGDYNGLNPCTLGHQLDTSFTPRPANGTKIFARVFDAPTTNSATYWGQSVTFSVNNSTVFDVSVAGLKATTMPKGVDPMTIVDSKGQTYYTDLIANINPLDPNDVFATSGLVTSNTQLSVTGHVSRLYTLQRATNLTASTPWTDVSSTGPLSTDTTVTLTDPSPPAVQKLFYRIKVTMP
jgi:hypothetical protein